MKLKTQGIRRCAIFLFFDKDGIVDDYIPHMIRELHKSVEYVLVVSNGYVNLEGMQKLYSAADEVFGRVNIGLDVGGYREGLFYIGFKKLAEYDELVLLNYTFFGPLYPFEEMFQAMQDRDVDFWGITKHHKVDPDPFGKLPYGYLPPHLQSFFLVLRSSLFLSYQYKDFIFNMENPKTYLDSILGYEAIFTKHFEDMGFRWEAYVNTDEYEGYSYCPNMFYIEELLKEKRCPIIKRRSFFTDYSDFLLNSCGEVSVEAFEYMRDQLDYPEDEIWDNLLRLENMSDIHRDLHLNYVLPEKGTLYTPEKQKIAIFLLVEWSGRAEWYRRFLKKLPEWLDVYVIADKECDSAKVSALLENRDYRMIGMGAEDFRAALNQVAEIVRLDKYDYAGVLTMRNLEREKPYSNDVSWQYSDWENLLASEDYISNLLEIFEQNKRLGMLIPPIPDYGRMFAERQDGWWGQYGPVSEWLKKCNIHVNLRQNAAPLAPMGGSFWVRGKALIAASKSCSGEELPTRDELLLAMPFLMQNVGFYTGTAYSSRYASVAVTNKDYMFRENNKVVFQKYGPNYHTVCVSNIKKDALMKKDDSE